MHRFNFFSQRPLQPRGICRRRFPIRFYLTVWNSVDKYVACGLNFVPDEKECVILLQRLHNVALNPPLPGSLSRINLNQYSAFHSKLFFQPATPSSSLDDHKCSPLAQSANEQNWGPTTSAVDHRGAHLVWQSQYSSGRGVSDDTTLLSTDWHTPSTYR